MAAIAEKIKPSSPTNAILANIRRFSHADLSAHGGWIAKRMLKMLSNLNEQQVRGWVASLVNSNDHLFLFQEHSVALAQACYGETPGGGAVVRERFVFAEEGHVDEAAQFYVEFARWAKSLGADVMLVEEMTDVPHDKIKEVLGGRLFTRQQVFVRV